ncbi:hypothetical protein [Candidatus Ulvibacter alkanivorans]|uniref:hypothetical protein n=1 Tax=Candidatus Ulvibacter alkanivorans TaxID=2267620 RepID=UPI000DF34E26|nr:hypothetical protein [Candidatus Ulvibacter alkanivorans]
MRNLTKILLISAAMIFLNCESDDGIKFQDEFLIGNYEFQNNADFRMIEGQGADSYVGSLENSEITIDFDFGWYTSSVENPPSEKFEVFLDTVDGHYLQILKAIDPREDETRIHLYKIQDSVDNSFGFDSLTMVANDLNMNQQNIVLELYNSWSSTD